MTVCVVEGSKLLVGQGDLGSGGCTGVVKAEANQGSQHSFGMIATRESGDAQEESRLITVLAGIVAKSLNYFLACDVVTSCLGVGRIDTLDEILPIIHFH